jgi:hypothetical protein
MTGAHWLGGQRRRSLPRSAAARRRERVQGQRATPAWSRLPGNGTAVTLQSHSTFANTATHTGNALLPRAPSTIRWNPDDADPDGDGRSNFLEYALGSDPTHPDASSDPRLAPADGHLVLTFPRRLDPDLRWFVEASGDLHDWTTVLAQHDGTAWSGPAAVEESGAGDVVAVLVVDPDPIAAHPRRYLRVRVQQLP